MIMPRLRVINADGRTLDEIVQDETSLTEPWRFGTTVQLETDQDQLQLPSRWEMAHLL